MKIRVSYLSYSREFCAVDDDTYDGAEDAGHRSQAVGVGKTPEEAIENLKEILSDE